MHPLRYIGLARYMRLPANTSARKGQQVHGAGLCVELRAITSGGAVVWSLGRRAYFVLLLSLSGLVLGLYGDELDHSIKTENHSMVIH
jgi:hypothetical protein